MFEVVRSPWIMLFWWSRASCLPSCCITLNCFSSGYEFRVSDNLSPSMYCMSMLNLSVLITVGTLTLNDSALVRIFASERVRLVLIWLSSCGCL